MDFAINTSTENVLLNAENHLNFHEYHFDFQYPEVEGVFEQFCNSSYHFNASFWEGSSQLKTEAAEHNISQVFDILNTSSRNLFVAIHSYYRSLENLRCSLLEYNSISPLRMDFRNEMLSQIKRKTKLVEWKANELSIALEELGYENDSDALKYSLRKLAHLWKPERNRTTAQGGTWREKFTTTFINPYRAFQPKK